MKKLMFLAFCIFAYQIHDTLADSPDDHSQLQKKMAGYKNEDHIPPWIKGKNEIIQRIITDKLGFCLTAKKYYENFVSKVSMLLSHTLYVIISVKRCGYIVTLPRLLILFAYKIVYVIITMYLCYSYFNTY